MQCGIYATDIKDSAMIEFATQSGLVSSYLGSVQNPIRSYGDIAVMYSIHHPEAIVDAK